MALDSASKKCAVPLTQSADVILCERGDHLGKHEARNGDILRCSMGEVISKQNVGMYGPRLSDQHLAPRPGEICLLW